MPGGLPGWTARPDVPDMRGGRQDGPGEEGGDPRLPRRQARRRPPRGRKLAHTARQEGCQGISQRGVPRNGDLPRAGRPVVRRPRLRSAPARATHQKPRRAIFICYWPTGLPAYSLASSMSCAYGFQSGHSCQPLVKPMRRSSPKLRRPKSLKRRSRQNVSGAMCSSR